jgi:5'-nucleotidase
MRILITNDDGVYSPGIAALAQVASRFGEVRVVAPDVEMSSAAHSITASRPMSYKRTDLHGLDAWRVNGTPADCVNLGTSVWENVELVCRASTRPEPRQRHVAPGTLSGARDTVSRRAASLQRARPETRSRISAARRGSPAEISSPGRT